MIKGLFGVTAMQVETSINEAMKIHLELLAHPDYDPMHLQKEAWQDLFPGPVIVKCGHCGHWAARKTACKHCGAPID